jgi:hypothetical protein
MIIKTLLPEPQDGIDRLDQWIEKRVEIKERFLDNIGRPNFPRKPQDIETIETTDGESYIRYKLRYRVGEEDNVWVYRRPREDTGTTMLLVVYPLVNR